MERGIQYLLVSTLVIVLLACHGGSKQNALKHILTDLPDTTNLPQLINFLEEDQIDSILEIPSYLPNGKKRYRGFRAVPQNEDDFIGVHLDEIYWPGVDVIRGDFRGASFRSARCKNTNFNHSDFRATDIRWSIFDYSDLDYCNFSQARLFHVKVNNASLTNCNFRGANMFGMEGHFAALKNCDFSGALMKDSEFLEADFTGSKAVRTKLFRAVLKSSKIDTCDFSYADFTGAGLEESTFINTRLWFANFQGSHLQGADFTGADLKGCNFFGAELETTNFNKANNIPEEIRSFINKEGFATGIWQDVK